MLTGSTLEGPWSNLSACGSGCYCGRWGLRWCWGQVIGRHPDLPSIALTDFNRSKVAPDLSRATVLTFRRNRRTPFSVFPDAIAIGTYRMRGSWIVRGVMAEVMQYLEHVRIVFFEPPGRRLVLCLSLEPRPP